MLSYKILQNTYVTHDSLYLANFPKNCYFHFPTQCLFPLVSQPLEDVLASLVPDELPFGGKRRHSAAVDLEELIKPDHKRLRSNEHDTPLIQEEHSAANSNSSGSTEKDGRTENGYPRDSFVTAELEPLQNEYNEGGETETEDVLAPTPCSTLARPQQSSSRTLFTTDVEPTHSPHDSSSLVNGGFDPRQGHSRRCSRDPHQAFHTNSEATTTAPQFTANAASVSQESTGTSIPPCVEVQDVGSQAHTSSLATATQSAVFVPVPDKLFWSNSSNLCWLDSMLVALVNCKGLRKLRPQEEPQESSVWQLIREYEAVCAAVQVHEQPSRG